ncbi:MAG TPA: hypothetical protein DFS52_00955 [Myxococcales bacterium]|jgi:hypothetical protein|nr:hypothetical protein [Myxococcales bacterium]
MHTRRLVRLAALAALGLVACAKNATIVEPPPKYRAADFQPLAIGNQWTYAGKVMGQPVEKTITITGVREGYFVDDANGRMRLDSSGLRDDKRYLLQDPIKRGHSWTSILSVASTERYEIADTGFTVSTPAGSFQDCILVRGTNRIDQRREMLNEWTFAPGVGIVRMATMLRDGDRELPQARIELTARKLQ